MTSSTVPRRRLPQLLADLKAAGFKIVHLRPKSVAETLPSTTP